MDVTPRQMLNMTGNRLHGFYHSELEHFRYGPGVFKLDYALDRPIPWKAQAAMRAGTVHIGPTLEEISASERGVWHGETGAAPYVLVVQTSLFDETRAPKGKHTLWASCHVPNGSKVDMSGLIENQIERFAPGFKQRILARSTMGPADVEKRNANYIGGDINGGVQDFMQLFGRPGLGGPTLTPRRTRRFIFVLPRRRRAEGCMECRGFMRRMRRSRPRVVSLVGGRGRIDSTLPPSSSCEAAIPPTRDPLPKTGGGFLFMFHCGGQCPPQ